MPRDTKTHHTSHHQPHHQADAPGALPPDPALLPLAVISLIEGMRERGLVAGHDEAIGAALTAALAIAIDTHGAGNEEDAIQQAEAIFYHLATTYRAGIADGRIIGRSRGGFGRGLR